MVEEVKSGATPLEGDGKRILMILGTSKHDSLCHAIAEAYTSGARGRGHVVRQIRLGELQFDPILREGYGQHQALEPDLLEAQRQIHWAEHLVFVYPVWWGGVPALLKGFFDRTFLPGFAFKYRNRSQLWDKLLSGRTADLLVTLDTPPWYFRWIYGAPAHRQMVRTILGFCGIKTRRLTEFAPVRPSSEEQRQGWLRQAENLGVRA
jgi:putative NADPH-quinone reductase